MLLLIRQNNFYFLVTSIPSNLLIAKIKNLENVCCLTITLPVNKQANYENMIGERTILSYTLNRKY